MAPLKIILTAVNRLSPQLKKINRGFAGVAKAAKRMGAQTGKVIGTLGRLFSGLVSKLFSIGKALALMGVAAITAFGFIVRNSIASTDALAKQASKIGTTTEALSKLRFVAEQTGIAQSTMDMALQRFVRRTGEAARGTGEAKGALQALNLNAQELVNMPLEDQMIELANAFETAGTDANKLSLAFKLFDSEGAALINILALGEEQLRGMFDEATALGLVMSSKAARGAEIANQKFGKLKGLFQGLTRQISAALAPALGVLVELLTKKLKKAIEESDGSIEVFANSVAINILTGTKKAISGVASMVNEIGKLVGLGVAKINEFRINSLSKDVKALNKDFTRLNSIVAKTINPEFGDFSADELFFMFNNGLRQNSKTFQADVSAMFSSVTQAYLEGKTELDELIASTQVQGTDLINVDGVLTSIDTMIEELMVKREELKETFIGPLQQDFVEMNTGISSSFDAMANTVQQVTLGAVSSALGGLQQLVQGLMNATEKGSKEHKRLYLISKGIAVAQAIVSAHASAASTMAAYASAAAFMGPAGPAMIAKGQVMAGIIKGIGYANAAVIAGTAVKSYDGGGFTGTGSRTGGVDGKGGFHAILHPNETVVDHTRGQSAGGGESVVINQTFNVSTGVATTVRSEIANLMPQIAEATSNAVAQNRMRGGAFSKQLLGR
jgi:hypothetical protein